MNIQKVLADALAQTEANGLVMGYAPENQRIFVLPIWEAESSADVENQAFATALRWADENGRGDIRVEWAYREDHNGPAPE